MNPMKWQRVPGLCIVLFLWLTSASFLQAADKHPFDLDDYSRIRSAQAAAISPDGKTLLYAVSFFTEKGTRKHEWFTISTSGENRHKLDLPENFEPVGFMKDGASLFGIYEVDRLGQLAIVPLDAAMPTRIISLLTGVHGVRVSPDGTRFAVTADPRPKDPLAGVHTVVDNDQNSIYVVGVDGTSGAWWCSSLKFVAEAAWSPDSSQIAVVSQTQKLGSHILHTFIDVCSASGAVRTAEIPNATAGIAWTNGGKELAFASTTTPVLTPDHLWTVPVSGGAPVDRTPKLEGTIFNIAGDSNGTVFAEMHKGVVTEVDTYRDGKLEPSYRWPGGSAEGLPVFSPFAGTTANIAFTVNDPLHPDNVAVSNGKELQRITHEGDDLLSNVTLGETQVVHWRSKDGINLEGIVTFPAGYQPGKKYPYIVFPHGGPEYNDPLGFDTGAKYLAGLGYVVMQPQYRGSTGYGSDFLGAIYQHFGDRAYSDVDSATDFAVAQGWADPQRLAIFGWSAGGFMTSWTVTQTHRYKAAIEGAGITDWLSFIPTSDTWQTDFDARMQEKDPAPMLQFSAVMFADRVTTPLLILHGEADIRVPTFQGREYYVLLAERGKTARMVTYPGSPHFPRLIEQQRDLFKEVADWLAKYNP
jgi:dipeptidyl aminopeptidase/acylaminoacyl peptidase